MKTNFDEYYSNRTREVLGEIELKIEKAQYYAIQAGFEEDMTVPKMLVRLLSLNRRIIDFLLAYIEIAMNKK